MSLSRISSINPESQSDTLMLDSTGSYLVAIIASNQSDTQESKFSIWVNPFEYLPIESGEEELYRSYIIKNGILPPGGSYESWRFAVGVEDQVYIRSNNGKVSFSLEAVIQSVSDE
jgi:hypothetical protein